MRNRGERFTFDSPYEQYAERRGQEATVTEQIIEPNRDYDAEVLPMYRVRFADGTEIEAWPEEVEYDATDNWRHIGRQEVVR